MSTSGKPLSSEQRAQLQAALNGEFKILREVCYGCGKPVGLFHDKILTHEVSRNIRQQVIVAAAICFHQGCGQVTVQRQPGIPVGKEFMLGGRPPAVVFVEGDPFRMAYLPMEFTPKQRQRAEAELANA